MSGFWDTESAATRYAAGRPFFHDQVINLIRRKTGLTDGLALGVDVACGTGQSTDALRSMAESVLGVDTSAAMLAQAQPAPGVRFQLSSSSDLPINDESVDIITVCNGFHWFDKPRFLAEARRVLKTGAWLVIYENHFRAVMLENAEFKAWAGERYGKRFPTPPRSAYTPVEDEIIASGLSYQESEEYSNTVTFTPERLVSYLMTHSNVTNAVELGSDDVDEVRCWLLDEVEPLFTGETGTFQFGGTVTYARKLSL